jgi:hypothetical protein
MEAKDTTDTFKVSINKGIMVEVLPPKNMDTSNRYPVCENTPIQNKNNTKGAILASFVVTVTKRNKRSRIITLLRNHGTRPKKRYQIRSVLGSNPAIKVSSFP